MYFCRCEVEIIAKKLYLRPMRIVDEIEIKINESEAGALFFVTDFANGGNDVFISRLLSEFAEQGVLCRLAKGVYYKPVMTKFGVFLTNGMVEIHNIAIERCFRHIANGRRNWLHTGSHEAAENLAFMYSLYESCKMNELDFGRYIEDILTRMKDGDNDYLSMLPCYYKTPKIQVEECA